MSLIRKEENINIYAVKSRIEIKTNAPLCLAVEHTLCSVHNA